MPLECYFSHSWAPEDVPLNVFVWETIADTCVLYVDREGAAGGAYYINRLEELIRKSDVFVSVLAYREGTPTEDGRPDYQLSCSAGSLFEIRLAERARKPRWIIYDDRTQFVPPDHGSDKVVYTAISAAEELLRGGESIRADGARWLESVRKVPQNTATPRRRTAALLVDDTAPDAAEVQKAVEKGLRARDAGYMKIEPIKPVHTDAEAISILQSSSLLVAEIGSPSIREIYGMAHALFIPTIRFLRDSQPKDIPRLLEGHPGGYQHDLILASRTAGLVQEVTKRASAMRDSRAPISEKGAGCAYLRRSLYRWPHHLFFSHNLAAADADLLRMVFDELENLGIHAWEYRHNNRAGVVWKDELQVAMEEATDIAFIFGNEFELSDACSTELKTILSRRNAIKSITPFLWGGRTRPNPDLSTIHHEPLDVDKKRAARQIVDRVVQPLRAKA